MARVEKTRNHFTQSEKGFLGWLMQLLRKGSQRWKPKQEAWKRASVGRIINPKTGKLKQGFGCEKCGWVGFQKARTDKEGLIADHIDPVIPVGKSRYICSRPDFNPDIHVCIGEVCDRMYVEIDHWQILCHTCHGIKTKDENTGRRVWKEAGIR